MDKKLSHRIYHSSLIGLLSTSVLLSLSAGNITASADVNQPAAVSTTLTNQAHSDDQLITKDVVRTINYVNPLTNEKHVIRQVASFQLDQDGKLVKTIHPGWQSYILPYLEGYIPLWVEIPPKAVTPNSADEVEEATYTKLIKAPRTTSSVRIEFRAIDGSPMLDKTTTIRKPHDEPVVTFTLPSPPKGWEYVEKGQLPEVIKTVPNSGIRYKFLVQKIQTPSHQEGRVENKQLCRTITLHLPTGDRVITQHALATRNVSVEGDKTHYGEWQISSFDEFQLPKVDGYRASLDKVASLQLTPDQLTHDPVTVEITYHKVSDDKENHTDDPSTTPDDKGSQTDTPTTSDDSTQTESSITKDETTQTDQSATVDEGNQTITHETTDTGVGDDSITDISQGTQTEVPTGKDDGTQTDNKQQNDSTQTETPTSKDEEPQTDKGSQTDESTTVDTGVGDDSIDEVDTQTKTPAVKDENTQAEGRWQDKGTQNENGKKNKDSQIKPSTDRKEDPQTDITEKDTGIRDDCTSSTDTNDSSNKNIQIKDSQQLETPITDTSGTNGQENTPFSPISNTNARTDSQIGMTEVSPKLDPLTFHSELDQLQQPLKELTTSSQNHKSALLPQTGNHKDIKTIISGALTMMVGAFLTMLHLRKYH